MTIRIEHSDALDLLRSLEDCSVDSLVSDPPSGISFMGKAWDRHNTYEPQTPKGRDLMRFGSALLAPWEVGFCAFIVDVFSQALRVIKPGGHGLIWALPRTSDLTALGLRVAGWEVRDSVHHMFGSGFPKSMDISKALDKAAGAERDTAPATPGAKRWEGWGTALKPGHEVWWLIRKPVSGTIAGNVEEWGTGGINVDASRITLEPNSRLTKGGSYSGNRTGSNASSMFNGGNGKVEYTQPDGRWPPNVLLTHDAGCKVAGSKVVRGSGPASGPTLTGKSTSTSRGVFKGVESTPSYQEETIQDWQCVDGCPVGEMGAQSGESVTRQSMRGDRSGQIYDNGKGPSGPDSLRGHDDTGTAARYFPQFRYSPKPSRAEREAGLDHLEEAQRDEGEPSRVKNIHPTVKSIDLMRWLTRLVTPPRGLVLDPFTGSGTTALACVHEGFSFVGSEQSKEYVEIAWARVDHADPAGAQTRRAEQGLARPPAGSEGQGRLF